MDNNYSKYFSASTEKSDVLSEVYSGTLMSENSMDYIIPDYVNDVDKILFCAAVPKIEGKFITGNGIEVEGTNYFYLLLATENNTLSSLVYSEPFDVKANIDGITDECIVSLIPRTDYVTARLLNPRKINIRSQVNNDTRVFCPMTLEPEVTGAQSLDDDMNLQRNYITVQTVDTDVAEEKNIQVSEDIELDSGSPAAAEIILCRVSLNPSEIKAHDGEVDVKTDAIFSCVYRTEDENYHCVNKKFTLNHTIANIGSDCSEWSARAVPGTVKAQISNNSYGEMKVIELDFTYDLELTCMNNRTLDAVCDMYSTQFECESGEKDIDVSVFKRSYATNLSVNSSAPRADAGAEKIKSIFTGNVFLKNVTVSYNAEKNKLVVEGTAEIALVGENNILVENELLFSPLNYAYPFKCEIDAGENMSTAEFITEAAVVGTKYRADSQNVYADFEVSIKIIALGKNRIKYVSKLSLDRARPVSETSAPITLCYPSGKETLWDIAKHYKITSDIIMASNGMTDDNIASKKVLLIPRRQAKRPVFSKVI